MNNSVLITQCLQNDMVRPIGRYDEVPNLLHIGHEEARRLMGENPEEGPLALTMNWAYGRTSEELTIIHVRDWHDANDAYQHPHMKQFGSHCLQNTKGAEFAFKARDKDRQAHVINSPGLNDFIGTSISEYLQQYAGQKIRVGLIGVWTDAKVYFLAYDLLSRFPDIELAVCSALSASSSKAYHLLALEQMSRLLGVKIIDSVGEFIEFLGDAGFDIPLPQAANPEYPEIYIEGDDSLDGTDTKLVRYLCRDARKVTLKALAGGYSGNVVMSCKSEDIYGHQQVLHVIKIGEQGEIGKERTAFERIESVMGNNAPRIAEFADYGGRGALKYRYAAMGGNIASTFKDIYCEGAPREKIEDFLRTVLVDELGRFYSAAKREDKNLFEYYGIVPGYAERMKQKIEKVLGKPADDEELRLPSGESFPNLYHFYKRDLEEIFSKARFSNHFSYVHGDLNGANIIIDEHENVWLIDFALTHYGQVLRDFVKLESDIMYIFTPIRNEADLSEAAKLTDILLQAREINEVLPTTDETGLKNPDMIRAFETIKLIRSFTAAYTKEDRNILPRLIGQLWYSGRDLTLVESDRWQKLWALYTASQVAMKIKQGLAARGPLRIDWMDAELTGKGRLGISILPGRRDRDRSMAEDMSAIRKQGATHVITLLTSNEFEYYGVEDLMASFKNNGLITRQSPMLDGGATSITEMDELAEWVRANLENGAHIMVHCVGGLGRSGLVAAGYLISQGENATQAIRNVRKFRSPKAVETKAQEKFLKRFAAVKGSATEKDIKTAFSTVQDVLEFAISEEDALISFYENMSATSRDPRVKGLFRSFAKSETKHVTELRGLWRKGITSKPQFDMEGLNEIVNESDRKEINLSLSADLELEDALALAMNKSKSGFKLYTGLAGSLEDEQSRNIFLSLADEEARHRIQLEMELDELNKLKELIAKARKSGD
jgi:protein-tyrosine phosphatase/rubrerythrin/nicotinamidase-related amidase